MPCDAARQDRRHIVTRTDDSFEAQADLFAPGTTDPAAARDLWANALARSRWRASE